MEKKERGRREERREIERDRGKEKDSKKKMNES